MENKRDPHSGMSEIANEGGAAVPDMQMVEFQLHSVEWGWVSEAFPHSNKGLGAGRAPGLAARSLFNPQYRLSPVRLL